MRLPAVVHQWVLWPSRKPDERPDQRSRSAIRASFGSSSQTPDARDAAGDQLELAADFRRARPA
ncbi:MAG: hypothetical protein U0835_18680 [Isosphaeraceae bacterium]